jgi:hypothetical protein
MTALLALAVAPLAAQHAQALAKQMDCLACHSGMQEAASLSEKRRGKTLKDFSHAQHLKLGDIAATIARALDQKTYLASPNKYNLTRLRAQLGEAANACQGCHRGLATADGALAKEHFPHMEDCLVCHSKIDNPFSCEQCHPKSFELKPSNHTHDFHDRHSRKDASVDKTTCASCHGRRFTCMGCH